MKKTIMFLILSICFSLMIISDSYAANHTHKWSSWEIWEEADCESEGEEDRWCLICEKEQSKRIPKTPHKWGKWKVTTKSTPFQKGEKERVCKNCDEVQVKSIAKIKLNETEKKVKAVVDTYLNAAKAYDWNKMNSCFAKKSNKYGYPTASPYPRYYQKYNKKYLSWEYQKIVKNGSYYNVYVEIVRPDLYKIAYKPWYNEMIKAFDTWLITNKNVETLGERAGTNAIKKYKNNLKNGAKRSEPEIVKIPVIKYGGKWKIKAKTMKIVDIATGYYNEAQENAFNDYFEYTSDYY